MHAISVEVQHTCRGCRQPVACNAVLPRMTCDRCGRVAELEARIWKLVLDEAVRQGPKLDATRERTAALTTDAGEFQIVYRRATPACLACRAPIALEVARDNIPRYVYTCACGMHAAARAMAGEIGLAAVELLLQEDPELLWPKERTEAVALKCNGCGGAQTVGAATPRIFSCSYCSVQVYVPDDLWALLHPVRPARPFVLGVTAQAVATIEAPPATQKTADAKAKPKGAKLPRFGDVYDMVVGADGTLFAVLELEDTGVAELFALDPEGQVVFRKGLPKKHRTGTRLAWMPEGRLALSAEGQRGLYGIDPGTGETVSELGTDKSGAFDIRKAACLTCDVDGTIIVGKYESGGLRLLRFSAAGVPVALWPGMAVPTPWSEEEYPPCLEEAPDRLVGAQSVICGVGWDGLLHVAGDQAVASYDRTGKKVLSVADADCGTTTGGPTGGGVHASRAGVVYTIEGGLIVRRYERGRGKTYLSTEEDGLLRTETLAAIGPDGTVWAAGPYGALRRFGPSRTLEWASPGARAADREAADEG